MLSAPVMLVFQLLLLHIWFTAGEQLCETDGCNTVARMLDESINTTIDPCEDFYTYACGGYIDKHPNNSRFQEVKRNIQAQFEHLLDREDYESVRPKNMPKEVMTLLSEMYKQCKALVPASGKQDDAAKNAWATELKEVIISNELGDIPLFTKSSKCDWNPKTLGTFLAKTHKLNLLYYSEKGYSAPAIFTPLAETVSRYKMTHILKLEIQRDDSYIRTKLPNKFKRFQFVMEEYTKAVNISYPWPAEDGKIDQEIINMVDFEHTLLLGFETVYNKTEFSYPDFKKQTEHVIDFGSYTDELLPAEVKDEIVNDHINQFIRTFDPDYFRFMDLVFEHFTCETFHNYVFYKLIEGSLLVAQLAEGGSCIETLTMDSPLRVGYAALYLQTYYPIQGSWNGVRPMTNAILHEMEQMIMGADWIEPATKARGKEKVDAMQTVTGASGLFYEAVKLQKFYYGIEISSSKTYYENRRELARWYMQLMMERIGPSDPLCANDIWYLQSPLKNGGHYTPQQNQIAIYPGFMLEPFHRHDFPMFYNFGYTGFTVGHEITHGFDNKGRHFDKAGRVIDWSDPDTDAHFANGAECFVAQYDDQLIEQITSLPGKVYINGNYTLQENIADNGGIRAAFGAYKTWKTGNGDQHPKFRVKQLQDMSSEQLFFISAAQLFCKSQPEGELLKQIVRDEHSPNKYRVNIPFKNFEDFNRAFQCKEDTPMNPPPNRRCRIW